MADSLWFLSSCAFTLVDPRGHLQHSRGPPPRDLHLQSKEPRPYGRRPPMRGHLHDRSLTMGVAGAARLAIAPPPPPYPPVAIMGPPPLAVPTSVVSLNLWAPPPPAQGIAPLAGVPSVYQRPNERPRKAPPAPAPPPAVSPRGSVARVLNDGVFPKLVPSNLPAEAKQVNQGDGIHTIDPYAPRPVVKAPPQGPYPVERRDIVATHQASPPPPTPAVDAFAGLERVERKVRPVCCGTSAHVQAGKGHGSCTRA